MLSAMSVHSGVQHPEEGLMKFGFITPNFDYCGDARVLAELAQEAEDAGWDGFFIWDHIQLLGEPHADPWIALAAMAMRTEHTRLGTLVTPVPRRHIGKLAREVATLDHLSGGRVILGVGAGAGGPEYTGFGDDSDQKTRAAKLDEGLEVLAGLWSGSPVKHHGVHYRVECAAFQQPLQKPRVPVWVAATWPARKPLRRAARWDGVVPIAPNAIEHGVLGVDELRNVVAYVRERRAPNEPFDVVQFGQTKDRQDTGKVEAYIEAGATWWIEYIFTWDTSLQAARDRVHKGPPRT
jgi:alkanesulfonate monooxygenase SsuD/methylene tetrahydromethanopterin reductase-like flavin-dependent oxidoreductase (luciferase family)